LPKTTFGFNFPLQLELNREPDNSNRCKAQAKKAYLLLLKQPGLCGSLKFLFADQIERLDMR
jgi:hypothetical protein